MPTLEQRQWVIQKCPTPAAFARRTLGTRYQISRHIEVIDDAIVDTILNDGPRILIVQAPPRHSKSYSVSRNLPAWYLKWAPDHEVLLTTYGAEFAEQWGRQARELFTQASPLSGLWISDEKSSAHDWRIKGHAGGMRTAGVGGPITGRGANLLIVDDPVKNQEEALSATYRDKVWDWWQSTASTRLEPNGVAIICQTRWHSDDLAGKLIQQSEQGGRAVRLLNLPAICEDEIGDPMGRREGDALWPERWPVAALDEIRRGMEDPYWWHALYQQNAGSKGRTEWPSEYFGEHLWTQFWPSRFDLSAMAVDPATGKDSKRGDYTAIVFVGIYEGRAYVDAVVDRMPIETTVERTIEMYQRHLPMSLVVEANNWQELALDPKFRQSCIARGVPDLPIRWDTNTTNKVIRIQARIGPILQRKSIRLANNSAGCKILHQQLRDFPLGRHDDGPDALEMALRAIDALCGAGVQAGQYDVAVA